MTPNTEAELAEILSAAKAPLAIQGGGTRGVAPAGEALSTRGLSGITLYEPGALTLVAKAGTSLAELEAVLRGESQRLAFEPPDLRDVLGTSGESTVGGVAASNASGPRRIAAGACRDFMLGVRFVDGAGRTLKNGGRVMKNVTGYDLVKLMAGSYGTLGVLTEVSLKVLPLPEMQICLKLEGLAPEAAVQAMSAALGSPFDVTGAARDAQGVVNIRLEGFEASVRYRAQELERKLASFGAVYVVDDQEACAQIWADLRDARAFAGLAGDLWRISVKPSDAPDVIAALEPQTYALDWGGGLIWALLPSGTDARARLNVAGHAMLMRAAPDTLARLGRFHPEPAAIAKISAGLRAKFDPKGILNAGLMGGAG